MPEGFTLHSKYTGDESHGVKVVSQRPRSKTRILEKCMAICEMSGCHQVIGDAWAINMYGGELGRFIYACEDCHEEYENAMAYGHPDMAHEWLIKTQEELATN